MRLQRKPTTRNLRSRTKCRANRGIRQGEKNPIWLMLLLVLANALFAQEPEIGRLIDCPTAAVLEEREFVAQVHLFTGGGMSAGGEYGILPNLSAGLYYGANNLVGNNEIRWFKYPGVSVAYRFLERDEWIPAMSVGFSMQGAGPYFDPGLRKYERFVTKAKGFWVT
ncbi:MAG: YjbH domain-containing protein, partial [Calditrichaeota bacterium]|nr:YjbH domain-containing protein [Calditrichota bacterium]